MTLANHVCTRLTALGVPTRVDRDSLFASIDGEEKRIRLDPEWEDAFTSYTRARSRHFDNDDWSFALNNSIEFPLVKLDPESYRENVDAFSDAKGNTVEVSRASIHYSLAHFDSPDYERYFDVLIRGRLERVSPRVGRPLSMLFRSPITAIYIAKGRKTPANLKAVAVERIQSCLVKMAVERHASFEFFKPRNRKSVGFLGETATNDDAIPRVTYEKNVVGYYKVARSSPFPSQSFLAYYHVLEYYFLKVSEDALHHQLRALINKTNFRSNTDGIDKVISLVRKQANQDNETEMLRKVLQRFVAEEDFVSYVNQIESAHGEKLYTKRRPIFGEQMNISLAEGHALSNAANVLKHVRNAIVHSSDRYKREECHIPLSDTENTIEEFIPIVRFFAEQVIFGTSSPHQL
ncbi:MAG: hypothetical protein ACYDC7_10015 [Acidithiobacillus ferrivorans]